MKTVKDKHGHPTLKADLAKYSKQELIEIIDKMISRVDMFQQNGYLEQVLEDIENARQKTRINEARAHLDEVVKARKHADELLSPYDGERACNVPIDIRVEVWYCIMRAKLEEIAWNELIKEAVGYYYENT